MIYIYFITILILFYHLFFYGMILTFINKLKQKDNAFHEIKEYPTITILCPAYNEIKVIENKIKSYLDLDYPKEKNKMIVISDDSSDGTNEVVRNYEKKNYLELVIQKPRKGKQSGHNLVEPNITSKYIVSTDANSIFQKESIKELVRTIENDSKIGLVSGELRLISPNEQESGEGLYWKYERWLKIQESKFKSMICANGGLFIIRRELFSQIDSASPDDFERTMQVLAKKYHVIYNPKAYVEEFVTERPIEEINRKIRIITQEWYALFRNINLLNFIAYPAVSWMLFSHKVIRWLLPLFSISILFSNLFLVNQPFFIFTLLFQIFIYSSGFYELGLEKKSKSMRLLKIPAYFTAMNYAALIALINVFKHHQFSTWEKK